MENLTFVRETRWWNMRWCEQKETGDVSLPGFSRANCWHREFLILARRGILVLLDSRITLIVLRRKIKIRHYKRLSDRRGRKTCLDLSKCIT